MNEKQLLTQVVKVFGGRNLIEKLSLLRLTAEKGLLCKIIKLINE